MGFLGGSTKSKQGINAFSSPAYMSMIGDITTGTNNFISPVTASGIKQENIDRFTPLGETADEARAYELMRAGFTPTAQSLNADLSMLENPYNDFVISEINRQSQGPNSLLKQALTEAGQFGSNRNILGANDVDLSRTNQIGTFLADQFNKNLGYSLSTLPTLRQNDAANLANIGSAQRELDYNIKQAPVTALGVAADLANKSGLSSAVANAGESKTSGGGFGSVLSAVGSGLAALGTGGASLGLSGLGMGIGSGLSSIFGNGLGQAVGGALSSSTMGPFLPFGLSDRETKTNIVPDGYDNGVPMYKFNYKEGFGPTMVTYRGTMADDAILIDPESVVVDENGHYNVDYDRLGIEMTEVA